MKDRVFDGYGPGIVAILLVITLLPSLTLVDDRQDQWPTNSLRHFSGEQEMLAALQESERRAEARHTPGWGIGLGRVAGSDLALFSAGGGVDAITDFSGTNNQVSGVEEPDVVKTDGRYLYIADGMGVVVLRAYPAVLAERMTRVEVGEGDTELFLHKNRLVAITVGYRYGSAGAEPWTGGGWTHIRVFEVSNPGSPLLLDQWALPGRVVGSRMVGPYFYLLSSSYLYRTDTDVMLPAVERGAVSEPLQATDIGYFEGDLLEPGLTLALGMDVRDLSTATLDSFLVRPEGTVYASARNLYLSGTFWAAEEDESGEWTSWTSLHRFAITDGRFFYQASNRVRGNLLNQFSLDEWDGHLRVAVTEGWGAEARNHLYVLDDSMWIVGLLENLAPGERVYSARFAGPRGYLVTFKKVDPFFVLDLSRPEAPRVLGELKIPGYSDYLHPYDGNHILGFGKDAHDMGDFAWYQGLKLSLFDVTVVSNPRESARYLIGDRGSDSQALHDHRAFLFSRERELLVIPVELAEVPDGSPPQTSGEVSWVGAYVFNVSPRTGFLLRGTVTHATPASGTWDWWDSEVVRSLYIEDVLYTVSGASVQLTDLRRMAPLGTIDL